MKLINKGKYISEEQLPKGNLPANAVKFREPESPAKLNSIASLYMVMALLVVLLFVVFAAWIHDDGIIISFNLVGFILAVLVILPHEFLHAIWFPKKAEVYLYYSLKNMIAFVLCTEPISKVKFILMSLCPNLVFGWVPFMLWVVFPNVNGISKTIFTFSVMSIIFGSGDYMNIFNAIRQMPKGSMQQLSGFNSYWFIEDKI